ncbi:MAG: hypothetical protein A2044_03195 [Candidatus Firestonebacteria bacterium GWA2_43_8]|nr:MAG: hypothetical protein A2044_03195 [Candidatus Firestonebacteria bacterium GWA2_43_8]
MLKAGVAKALITPSKGIEMAGYGMYLNRRVKGVHDDLYAKALLLDDGKNKVMLISCDIIGFDGEFVAECRKLICKKIDIESGNIMISATHTHSGPATGRSRGWGVRDEKYMKYFRDQVVKTAVKAEKNMKPAKLGMGKGKADIGYNRTGKVTVTHDEEHKVDDSHYSTAQAKDYDKTLLVIKITDLKNKEIALLYNYGVHAVLMGEDNYLVSADWPGYTAAKIEKKTKGFGMFLQGFCGDVDVKFNCTSSFEKARIFGEQVADEVLKVSRKIKMKTDAEIKVLSRLSKLPVDIPDKTDIKRTLRLFAKQAKEPKWKRFLSSWAKDVSSAIKMNPLPYSAVEVSAVSLAKDIFIVTVPAELYTKWGLKIKALSKVKNTLVVCYANGDIGYIPDQKDFDRKDYASYVAPMAGGGFRFKRNVGEVFISEINKLLKMK